MIQKYHETRVRNLPGQTAFSKKNITPLFDAEIPRSNTAARSHCNIIRTFAAHALVWAMLAGSAYAGPYYSSGGSANQSTDTGSVQVKTHPKSVRSAKEQNRLDAQLFASVENGNLLQAKSWLEKGANVHATAEYGETPLHVVARYKPANWANWDESLASDDGPGHWRMYNPLGPYSFDDCSGSREIPENAYCYEGICNLLMAAGAKVDAASDGGTTPLMVATEKGHLGMCRLLIAAGANVNAKNHYCGGIPPLGGAIRSGSAEICKLLIENGAHVDIDMLETAGYWGRVEVFSLLLEQLDRRGNIIENLNFLAKRKKIDVNADIHGQTPLEWAITLLEYNAEKCAWSNDTWWDDPNQQAKTPAHHYTPPRHEQDVIKICKRLIRMGAKLNLKCSYGYTPLHHAASINCLGLCKFLVKMGASKTVGYLPQEGTKGFLPYEMTKMPELRKLLKP